MSSDVDPLDVLRNAISMELEGKSYFESAAEGMRHQRARDTFASLVKQEQRHIEVLQGELSALSGGGEWESLERMKDRLPTLAPVSVFQDREVRKMKLDPSASELEVLKVGMEIERKSIEYYRTAGSRIDNAKAGELFNWLVGEEAGHLTILNAEYEYRTKSGFYYDNMEFSLEVM